MCHVRFSSSVAYLFSLNLRSFIAYRQIWLSSENWSVRYSSCLACLLRVYDACKTVTAIIWLWYSDIPQWEVWPSSKSRQFSYHSAEIFALRLPNVNRRPSGFCLFCVASSWWRSPLACITFLRRLAKPGVGPWARKWNHQGGLGASELNWSLLIAHLLLIRSQEKMVP